VKRPASKRKAENAATGATADCVAREAPTSVDPPGLEPLDSDWYEPEWRDPAWTDFVPRGRPPTYAFTLAVSPWYREHYPDKAANLWDALHAGRASEPGRLSDREAGE
jgi:hypothetical protein